jgi:hypothetical protein
MTSMIEQVARAIADGLGDDYDHAFVSKTGWVAERGERGGRFRDINEPFQGDYIDAATAALKAMREPTPEMVEVGANRASTCPLPNTARMIWAAMIDQAIEGAG